MDPINARVQFSIALKSFCNYQQRVVDKLTQRQMIQLKEQKGNNEDERIFELKNKANAQVQNQIKLGEERTKDLLANIEHQKQLVHQKKNMLS